MALFLLKLPLFKLSLPNYSLNHSNFLLMPSLLCESASYGSFTSDGYSFCINVFYLPNFFSIYWSISPENLAIIAALNFNCIVVGSFNFG